MSPTSAGPFACSETHRRRLPRFRKVRCAGLALLLSAAACAAHWMNGSINGITWHMTFDRPAVPGGVPHSIDLVCPPGVADRAELWVDGVPFGEVRRGQHVEVDSAAMVTVDGVAIAPRTQGFSTEPQEADSDQATR